MHVFSGEYLHQRTVVAKENLKEKILSRFSYPGVMISLLQRQQKFQVNKRISLVYQLFFVIDQSLKYNI